MRVLSLPGRHFKGGNPYFREFCESLDRNGCTMVDIKSANGLLCNFDIVNVHFPEHYVTEQTRVGALKWTIFYLSIFLQAKARRRVLVWTVHDVEAFKKRHLWLLKPYMRLFESLVDGHIFLSETSRDEFYRRHPQQADRPHVIIPHSPYNVSDITPLEVKKSKDDIQSTNKYIIGFLGDIKRYKNPSALNALPDHLLDGRSVTIVVAGRADQESKKILDGVLALRDANNTVRIDERVSDFNLDRLMRTADAVFLPYSEGWNSGLAMRVLSNGGRVVASDLPIFRELAATFHFPWVSTYGSNSDLVYILNRLSSYDTTQMDRETLARKLKTVSWSQAGKKTKVFYEGLLSGLKPASLNKKTMAG